MTSLDGSGEGSGSGDDVTERPLEAVQTLDVLAHEHDLELCDEFIVVTPKQHIAATDQSQLNNVDFSAFPAPGFASVLLATSESGCEQTIASLAVDAAKEKLLFLTNLFRADTTFLSLEELQRFATEEPHQITTLACGKMQAEVLDVTRPPRISDVSRDDVISHFSGDESSGDVDIVRDEPGADDVTVSASLARSVRCSCDCARSRC